MTTAQNVIDRINRFFSDSSNQKFTEEQKLEAVNVAIDNAWPQARRTLQDSSIVLASTTYTYTPTAVPEEEGFAQAYVTYTSVPDIGPLRGLRQVQNGAAWTIVVPMDVAASYVGQTLKLYYHARHARAAVAGDTVTLPLAYLWAEAAKWLCAAMMVKGATFDAEPYEKLLVLYQRDREKALLSASAGCKPLPLMISQSENTGEHVTTGRYGEGIVRNP